MSDLKMFPAGNIRKADFEKFEKEVILFLRGFTRELLAKWMGRDAGNLSRKLNGAEAVTRKDLRDFESKISSVIIKLEKGMAPHRIELEMTDEEDPLVYKNVWEEIRLMKETLQDHDTAIQELKSEMKERQDGEEPQNP